MAPLSPAALAGASAPTTVSTTSIASSASSIAAVVVALPASASARVAAPTRAQGGASVATFASAPIASVAVPAVVIAAAGERASLLAGMVLFWGGPNHLQGAVAVGVPQARHQRHRRLRQPLTLPGVRPDQVPRRAHRKEAFLRQLQQ